MNEFVIYYPEGHAAHHMPGHPERPERIEAIRTALLAANLWEGSAHLAAITLPQSVLQAVHKPAYLSYLEKACQLGRSLDADTYTTPASWQLALDSAGGAAHIASSVWRRENKRGFALTRPPGHHAMSDRGLGFCLLNNIALAAEYLLQHEQANRLAIVDLDLHHGNGTQEIFWRRPEVVYISTHQYPHYPGSGYYDETGGVAGKPSIVNIPLPPFSGDGAFQASMGGVILPLLDRFAPEMILVSFGFDTHWRDPLGQLLLSAGRYAGLISDLAQWSDAHCNGRIALFLEGGYDLEAASVCGRAVVESILGKPWTDELGASPYPEGTNWQWVIEQVRKLWEL